MQLDYQRFIKEGAPYINEFVRQTADNDWDKLVQEKMPDAPPADLEGMKTLWMHGYVVGAENSINIVHQLIQNKNDQ